MSASLRPGRRSLRERLFPSVPVAIPGRWGRRDLRILSALAETFVPGDDGARRAALAAERIDRGLERGQVRLLRLALRAFDSRIANLLLVRRPVRLTRLSQAGRERYLATWASSRLNMRRSVFQAFKRILLFVAYADPGASPAAPNRLLAAIGYRLNPEPVAEHPTSLRVAEQSWADGGLAGPLGLELEADIVVVGSGAGGGVVACELARAGRGVLVVEAGPLVAEPDMPVDELTAFDRLFLDGGLAATSDASIPLLAGACVGGGTTVNWATCLEPPAAIRDEWATRHGLEGFDGAEYSADLAVLALELGLAGPPSVPPKDAILMRGAAALGIDAQETLRNAAGCGNCEACPFGCRSGAKRSTLRVHLEEASRRGARLLPGVSVDRVLVSAARVTGIEARLPRPDGSSHRLRIRANQVVVAAGALRTPGVLERSSVGHSALGRFLRIHPVSALVGRFEGPVEMWRGTMQAARSLAFAPGYGGGAGGFTIESVPAHPGLVASAMPWTSAAAHSGRMAQATHLAPLIAITRDRDWGRVTPLRSGRAKVDYRLRREDVGQLRDGLVQMARILQAAGAEEVFAPGRLEVGWASPQGDAAFRTYLERLGSFDFRPNVGGVFSAHQMGTARMGREPGLHVCDPHGRVRWAVAGIGGDQVIRGLYVADSSLFPTALGINPMLTVMLLARRVARTVIAEGAASS